MENCQLCEKTTKNFTCCSCIKEGNFYTTNANTSCTKKKDNLKFSCKEKKFRITCAVSKEYQKRIEHKLLEKEKYHAKKKELIMLKDRIETLQLFINETKFKNIKEKNENEKLYSKYSRRETISENLKLKWEKLRADKINLTEKNFERDHSWERLSRKRKRLKDLQVSHVQALVKHIFPLSARKLYGDHDEFMQPILSIPEMETSDVVSEVISAAEFELEDATRIVHVDGEWVSQDIDQNEYTIVEVGMPTSKDFIRYYEWLKSYRSEPRKHESSIGLHGNAVLKIPASLVYSTQLTVGLSSYLDICLPYHVEYYDFSIFRLSRKRLNETINRLSHNIMHLCFSQNVSFTELNPHKLLKNLQLLVSNENLGRWGCFETKDYKLNETLFDSDSSAEEINDSDCDNMSGGDQEEWDKLLDIPPDISEIQSIPSISSGEATAGDLSLTASSASGIVSSAAASVISGLWSWKR